jgi:hypothetical protein
MRRTSSRRLERLASKDDPVLPVTWRLRVAARHRRGNPFVTGATTAFEVPGPVVVGGVGGSGTRVVEEMLRLLGVYTGADLNTAGDNRWFTLLCKLPRWDLRTLGPDSEVERALGTFERTMTGRLDLPDQDGAVVSEAYERSRDWWRRDRLIDDRSPRWLRARIDTLLRPLGDWPSTAPLWGWKEPNTHLMIHHLERHFGERLRYVHVIRNGLHMTQSRNQLQVRRWGSLFGLPETGVHPTPAASLDYWIRANEAAIEAGETLSQSRFLVLNYDDLCAHPEREVVRFVGFLGLHPSEDVLRRLAAIPHNAASTPRAECDVEELFGKERVARVESFGFHVTHPRGGGPVA